MSVCDSVVRMINQNGRNYNHQTCYRDSPLRVLAHQLMLGHGLSVTKSEVQKVQKLIEGDRVRSH